MKISVIIPTYNEEKFIDQCLKSLSNQEVPPDEIILIDNNCTDQTIPIAKKYSNVKIIQEKTQGITPTRNKGFNTATSEIIARCDADTILPPNWIKNIKENFKTRKIDALTGPVIYYDLFLKTPLFSEIYMNTLKFLQGGKKILLGMNMILTKKIWNRIKHNVCLDDKKVHEDIDLSLKIANAGGIIYKDKTLVVHSSARRIKKKPSSFFVEYPIRLVKTLIENKKN
ncbi:MAG: glycosyltransferase [Alphaproteobacteria bacterium]